MEEIGEAALELKKLGRTKMVIARLRVIGQGNQDTDILMRRKMRLAVESGDVLVTLGLQSGMHGSTIEQCKAESGRLTTGYGSDWYLGKVGHPPKTWAYIEDWAALLGDALANLDSPHRFDIAGLIGAVAICVEDAARIELAMLGPECLALALVKIEGRQGEVVDGVFVKDEECDAA